MDKRRKAGVFRHWTSAQTMNLRGETHALSPGAHSRQRVQKIVFNLLSKEGLVRCPAQFKQHL